MTIDALARKLHVSLHSGVLFRLVTPPHPVWSGRLAAVGTTAVVAELM
jgi:hypothetical protein